MIDELLVRFRIVNSGCADTTAAFAWMGSMAFAASMATFFSVFSAF